MTKLKITGVAALAVVVLAGCETGGTASGSLAAGLSYDDFQRQYNVDQATMVAMDANADGVITENEWQAAGY
jgi:hypothetical protein